MRILETLLTSAILCGASSAFVIPTFAPSDLFSLKGNKSGVTNKLLTYSKTNGVLDLHEIDFAKKASENLSRLQLASQVQFATLATIDSEERIIVVTGKGASSPDAPVEVNSYNLSLKDQQTLFRQPSKRAQVTTFKEIEGGFLITFYDSKYHTLTGKLFQKDGQWQFKQLFRQRMAANVDTDGANYLVGRAYGDAIGMDGDLKLVTGGKEIVLPTLRGVSSALLVQLDADKNPEVLAGDGWHQNYGKIAEPRLTLFDYNEETQAYEPKVLINEKESQQFRFDFIDQTSNGLILAGGMHGAHVFAPQKDWAKVDLKGTKGGVVSKAVDLGNNTFAVFDGRVSIQTVTF